MCRFVMMLFNEGRSLSMHSLYRLCNNEVYFLFLPFHKENKDIVSSNLTLEHRIDVNAVQPKIVPIVPIEQIVRQQTLVLTTQPHFFFFISFCLSLFLYFLMSNSKFHSFGKRLSFQSHDIQGEKTKKPPKITTQLTSKTHRTSFGSGSGHSLNSNESSSPASRMCRRFSSLLSGGTTYDLRVLRTSLFSKHTSHDVDDNSSASSLDSDHASPSLTHFPVTPPSTTAHTAVTMSSSDVCPCTIPFTRIP
ncbi:hypothetical protein BDF14DRAFT_1490859 [Spinellus fusiger]|nr:hypothetical protein BDF14DRAFT_1490859 [Spinellus fusiger]